MSLAIYTDAPLIPLTQMIGDDGLVSAGKEVRLVLVTDEETGHWIAKTLTVLGYSAVSDPADMDT